MRTVSITISIPEETFGRLKRIAPKKEWGENHKREFYTKIFLDGLESADFLGLENRRLENILKITRSFLKPDDQNKIDAAEDFAREIDALAQLTERKPGDAPTSNGNGAV